MKALSLKQPWAELILQGRKKIEIRKWNTKFRGDFLIHSSRIPDAENMNKFGFTNLPCGFIVGKAKLIDVKKYIDEEEFSKDKNLHLATGGNQLVSLTLPPPFGKRGANGFILENVKSINPIPAKGKLNFWDFELK